MPSMVKVLKRWQDSTSSSWNQIKRTGTEREVEFEWVNQSVGWAINLITCFFIIIIRCQVFKAETNSGWKWQSPFNSLPTGYSLLLPINIGQIIILCAQIDWFMAPRNKNSYLIKEAHCNVEVNASPRFRWHSFFWAVFSLFWLYIVIIITDKGIKIIQNQLIFLPRKTKAMEMVCTMERSKIQVIYDACNAVFSQKELPTFQQIQWLRNLLGIYSPSSIIKSS